MEISDMKHKMEMEKTISDWEHKMETSELKKTISDLEHKLEMEMEKRLQRAESERDQARGTAKSSQR
jgi:hypothetical protein